MPARTYQDYERGLRAPGADAIECFVRAGINANWLLTGEGEMRLSSYSAPVSEAPRVEEPRAGYVAVSLFNDVSAAAGHGAVVGSEAPDDALMFKEEWIRFELGARPSDLCLIRVSGDSMEPTLRAGDVILVDHSARNPDREGIYILRMDGMLLVKRIQAMPGGLINVSSDNAAFSPWQLKLADMDASQVAIIGRVVWSGRRL